MLFNVKNPKLALKGSKWNKQLFLICLLFLGLFSACRKESEEVKPDIELNAQNISNLQTWYKSQIKPIQEKSAGAVIFDPQWGEGKLHQLNDGTKLAVFPVWRELAVQYFEVGFVRRLVVHLSANDEVISGKIMEMISSKEYLRENKEEIPVKFYQKIDQSAGVLLWESNLTDNTANYDKQQSCNSALNLYAIGCTVFIYNGCGFSQQFDNCHTTDGGSSTSNPSETPNVFGFLGNDYPGGGGNGGGSGGGAGTPQSPITISEPCQLTDNSGNCIPTDTGENLDNPLLRSGLMQAAPINNASKTQSPVSTPFRSLLFNEKLYILKPSPAEIQTLNKESYILHYAGHNVRPDVDFEDIFEFSYPSSDTPLLIYLNTDEAINQFIQGNGLQYVPPLTSAIKEAEIANYLTNYKIIDRDNNGQLAFTEYTIMMNVGYIEANVKNAEAQIYIILDQADIWRQGMNYRSRYEATQIQEYRDLILSEAELLLKNEVNPLVDIFQGEGKVLVMGKNNAPPASFLSEIGNRNALGFRQSRVICGDTGVLTW